LSEQHLYPAPAVYVDGKVYFDAANEGKLLVRKCADCGEFHFYPRVLCPFCFSDKTEWVQASGKGVIYSYSIMRVAAPPFAIAYVTLEEGVTMMTHIVDSDFEQLNVGQPVRLVFRPTKGGPQIPMFTRAGIAS
jgi:uncharacterized OB-fold protein